MLNIFVSLHPFAQATIGGLIIGLASWLLLAALGRVAGISGIAASALFGGEPNAGASWRWWFLAGLIIVGGLASWLLPSRGAAIASQPGLVWTLIAGLLVGFGSVLGSGCTSGHGVCGIGRRSGRSIMATLVFMAAGMATVTITALLA